jgi:antirestriction protein ArdC
LKRDLAQNQKEREKYAFEELVAELGAAFLCAHHGIAQNHPPNHALYIKSWLKALQDDKTFIFKASAQAAKAVDFLDQLVRGEP